MTDFIRRWRCEQGLATSIRHSVARIENRNGTHSLVELNVQKICFFKATLKVVR